MDTNLTLHVATQCAPVLLGLKMSNILITHPNNRSAVKEMFQETKLDVFPMVENKERSIFLIFDKSWLQAYVRQEENASFLVEMGYHERELVGKIKHMAHEYAGFLAGERSFPHEMGIFLGYPLADVRGFMIHQGKNYLYAGYWKVYQNVEQAKIIFESYDRARKWLCELVQNGVFMGRKEESGQIISAGAKNYP